MSIKSRLNEYCQKHGLEKPQYNIIDREGPPHNPIFTVECIVKNERCISTPQPTRKKAEEDSALRMLWKVEDIPENIQNIKKSECSGYNFKSMKINKIKTTVMIDGDNVHEVLEWISHTHEDWNVHYFVTQTTIVPENGFKVKVHRSLSNSRDATDVIMIIYITRYLQIMENNETLVIVSRDKIFQTLVYELNHPHIKVAKTIGELREIEVKSE